MGGRIGEFRGAGGYVELNGGNVRTHVAHAQQPECSVAPADINGSSVSVEVVLSDDQYEYFKGECNIGTLTSFVDFYTT
jgi:hypothetical protein